MATVRQFKMPKRVRFLLPEKEPRKKHAPNNERKFADTAARETSARSASAKKAPKKEIGRRQEFRYDGVQLFAELFSLPSRTREEYYAAVKGMNEKRRKEGKRLK